MGMGDAKALSIVLLELARWRLKQNVTRLEVVKSMLERSPSMTCLLATFVWSLRARGKRWKLIENTVGRLAEQQQLLGILMITKLIEGHAECPRRLTSRMAAHFLPSISLRALRFSISRSRSGAASSLQDRRQFSPDVNSFVCHDSRLEFLKLDLNLSDPVGSLGALALRLDLLDLGVKTFADVALRVQRKLRSTNAFERRTSCLKSCTKVRFKPAVSVVDPSEAVGYYGHAMSACMSSSSIRSDCTHRP